MHDFLHNVGQVIVALWQLGRRRNWAPRAWNFYTLWVSRLTRLALVVVIGQPIAVILVSLTGVHELTVLVALTPVAALLFLVVVASLPRYQDELAAALAIGAVASAWDRTAKILGAIIRGLLLFLLLDLAFGLYFSLLPVEEDRGLILWIVLFGVILLTSVALLPPGWRKALTNTVVIGLFIGSVVVLAVVVPLVLANGGRDETRRDIAKAFEDEAEAAPAVATPSGATVTWVTLRGFDDCSAVVDLDAGSPGENFFGMYPGGTRINFLSHDRVIPLDDLRAALITASGPVCFYGPAGGKVRVRQVPDA